MKLLDGLNTARRCNCSYCRMMGAVVVSAEAGDFSVESGQDVLTVYRFNTKVADHYFCSKCGIHTHHRRRSNPNQYSVNAACLKGVSPFDFHEVPVFDGITHPRDRDGTYRIVGHLRYSPS
ncbi:MAG TPA: GFA family protein [Candidatus Binataceae bacterium]|nr:GFA family protein [Candidatus Binataceae bacterium]